MIAEMKLLAASVAGGMICLIGYELFCMVRILFGMGRVITGIYTLLYWSLSGGFIFAIYHRFGSGEIRGYAVLGVICGMMIVWGILKNKPAVFATWIKKELQIRGKQGKMSTEEACEKNNTNNEI